MAKVYVMFRSSNFFQPTFEPVDPEVASIKQKRYFSKWDASKILGDPTNTVITIGESGFRHMFDFAALEQHFKLPKNVESTIFKTREHKSPKGLREQYITLKQNEMVIVVRQQFPSSVFEESDSRRDQHPLTVEDFFDFFAYEVVEEKLPIWGRTLINQKFGRRTIVDAIKLSNDWYATWTSQTIGGDQYDEDPWTTEYISLIHKSGKVIKLYEEGYYTWSEDGFLKIRLSRSGKSIVITPSNPDYESEIVIPVSQYLSE